MATSSSVSHWCILGVILLAGMGLRAAYLKELVDKPDFDAPLSDAGYNDYWARGIATGDWTPPPNEPDPEISLHSFFRPPGYPYFLALVYLAAGTGYLAPRIVQMFLGLAGCILVYLLGRAALGRGVGLVAAALTSVYWAFIYFEGELQPPVLLVFLTLGLMNLLRLWAVRPTYVRTIGSGLVLGAIALVRPNVLLFVPVWLLWLWWVLARREAGRRFSLMAVVSLASVALAVAPATIRNQMVAGDFVLISANGGVNLYIGNNAHTSLVTPRIPDLEKIAGRSGWNLFAYPEIVRGIEAETGRDLQYSDVSRHFSNRAWNFIRAHPGQALGYAARRAALLWGPQEVSNNKVIHYERKRSAVLRLIPGFPAVMSGFVIGLLIWPADARASRKQERPAEPEAKFRVEVLVVILLFVVAYGGSFLPFLAAGRFRVPLIPLLLLFAAYALFRLGQLAVERNVTSAVICAVIWSLLCLIASHSFVPYRPDLGSWHLDRATAYRQKGEIDLAIPEYQAAAEANPTLPDIFAALGSTLATQGKFDEAIANYRKAIELNPSFAELRRKLALLLDQLGLTDQAIEEYRAALQVSPENIEALYQLGGLLGRTGSNDEAMAVYRRALEIDPDLTGPRVNLGVLLQNQGDLHGAIREFRRALEADPNMFEAHFDLASALSGLGRMDEAYKELSIALHIQPDHPAAHKAMKALQGVRQKSATSPDSD